MEWQGSSVVTSVESCVDFSNDSCTFHRTGVPLVSYPPISDLSSQCVQCSYVLLDVAGDYYSTYNIMIMYV